MTDERTPTTATRSVWVSLRKVSPRFDLVVRNVRHLEDQLGDTKLRGADILYCTENDTALLRIRLDADRVTDAFIEQLRKRAADFGASIIDVGRLAPEVRERFSAAYQRAYTVRFPGIATSGEALEVLGRHLGALLEQPAPRHDERALPAVLRVRFRRGDRWQLGRARSMTASSISVATGCPPRKGDIVEIEIAVDERPVTTPAIVLAVTPPETAAMMGAFGFGARFTPPDDHVRVQLERIKLILDRDPSLVERPPSRRHVRYPVRWGVTVGMGSEQMRVALDISESGMFVASDQPVRCGTPTGLVIPLEHGEQPIHAGARVTRVLDGAAAATRAMPAGFGLQLTSMSASDARRYDSLVQRISRRAGRHVCVGAAPTRLDTLTDALASVGYAASGTSDAADVLARSQARAAPDLVIVDDSLDRSDPRIDQALVIAAHAHPARFFSYDGAPSHVWGLADAALE